MWTKSPLGIYLDKLDAMKTAKALNTRREKFVKNKFHAEIWDIISYGNKIAWILKRFDDELQILSNSNKKGMRDYPFGTMQYINIDLDSFIIFSRILMDKIARIFRDIIAGGKNLSGTSFFAWYKNVGSYQGENFEIALQELFRVQLIKEKEKGSFVNKEVYKKCSIFFGNLQDNLVEWVREWKHQKTTLLFEGTGCQKLQLHSVIKY